MSSERALIGERYVLSFLAHLLVKRKCFILTFNVQQNILRTLSSTSVKCFDVHGGIGNSLCSRTFFSNRYDRILRQKTVNAHLKRSESSNSPTPPASNSGPSLIPPVVKGMNNRRESISTRVVFVGRGRKSKMADVTDNYADNKLITAVRAMHEFLLKPS